MPKFIRVIPIAAGAAFIALGAPAAGAPVSAITNATGATKIVRPLQLASKQNFDLGTILLSGAAPFTATISINRSGTFSCDSNSGKVTCTGSPQVAIYNVSGTKSQAVTISAGKVTLTGSNGGSLTLTPDFNSVVTLANSGAPGSDFSVGGSITVANTTVDGVYTGTFSVTADYQ